MCKFYILIWLMLDFVIGYSFAELKRCNTETILRNKCPTLTRCVEQQPGSYDGVCQCISGYIFNPKSTSDDDYCKVDDLSRHEISKKTNRNDSSDEKIVINDKPNAQLEEKLKSPRPHHSHLVAGVLIPIILVLIAIGGIYAYKKLHITRHIRNSVRTHRSRPFYEDVMLGTNDNDDPPLI